jgi:hypothetical protein
MALYQTDGLRVAQSFTVMFADDAVDRVILATDNPGHSPEAENIAWRIFAPMLESGLREYRRVLAEIVGCED